MSQDQYLVYATSDSDNGGAGYFETTGPTNSLAALHVDATGGTGIEGHSKGGIGVSGTTEFADSLGVITAVYGKCTASPPGSGYAGVFEGRVDVKGTFTKSSGQFKIDHPLDPANKYLSHSFVESSEMKNIY